MKLQNYLKHSLFFMLSCFISFVYAAAPTPAAAAAPVPTAAPTTAPAQTTIVPTAAPAAPVTPPAHAPAAVAPAPVPAGPTPAQLKQQEAREAANNLKGAITKLDDAFKDLSRPPKRRIQRHHS